MSAKRSPYGFSAVEIIIIVVVVGLVAVLGVIVISRINKKPASDMTAKNTQPAVNNSVSSKDGALLADTGDPSIAKVTAPTGWKLYEYAEDGQWLMRMSYPENKSIEVGGVIGRDFGFSRYRFPSEPEKGSDDFGDLSLERVITDEPGNDDFPDSMSLHEIAEKSYTRNKNRTNNNYIVKVSRLGETKVAGLSAYTFKTNVGFSYGYGNVDGGGFVLGDNEILRTYFIESPSKNILRATVVEDDETAKEILATLELK